MSRFTARVMATLQAAVTLAMVQAVVGTVVLALLYRDLLLPPAAWFPTHIWDGFTLAWLAAADSGHLPQLLNRFLPAGFTAKLVLAPHLLATNLATSLALAPLVMATVAGLTGLRPAWGKSSRRLALTALVVLLALEVVIHAVAWITTVTLPAEPTLVSSLRNFARNFLHDGTVVGLFIVALSAAPAWLLVARPGSGFPGLAAAAILVAALSAAGLNDAGATASPEAAPQSAPVARDYNVILISIDSLRADHIGAYGYPRQTSPAIDALARDGVLFRHASSTTSWTLPGHMSMLTGRSLLGHGVVSDDRQLTPDVPIVAESFQAAGYQTHGIVSAPYVEARYGFGRGFDSYDDHTINFATHGASYLEVTAPLLQRTAESWLEGRDPDKPFFLFLHYWDVHYDYIPPSPYDRMFDPDYAGSMTGENFYFNPQVRKGMDPRDLEHLVALYDGEIRLVDDHLAELRATLDRLGLAEDTVMVVTADHGDEFFEHGRKGHHRTLYDEVTRVPLIVYVPGHRPTRPVVDMETSIIDIVPTMLGLTGIEAPAGVEGADLSAVAFGDAEPWDRRTESELYRFQTLNVQVSQRTRDYKIIHHFKYRRLESYDLTSDPAEQRNLSPWTRPTRDLMASMRNSLSSLWPVFRGRILEMGGVHALEVDAETEERLRALGYME